MSIINFTTENFEADALRSSKPVVVDFWASWCGPCKMISPIIEKLADEFDGRAIVGKVNVDEQHALAANFKIMSIPTVLVLKDGKVVEQHVGAKRYEEYVSILEKHCL